MIKAFSKFLGLVFFAVGIVLSLWLSTSVLGRARSQTGNPAIPAVRKPFKEPSDQLLPGAASPATPTASVTPAVGTPQASDLPPPTQAEESRPESLPIFQNPEGYSYDPTGRRDPFRPYGQSQTAAAPEVRTNDESAKPGDPLQQFDVTQLKVVGIMWEIRNPKAMVKDPNGKLYMIQRQTRIGRNNGFVAIIREGEIVVVEPAVGDNGTQTASTRILTLTR